MLASVIWLFETAHIKISQFVETNTEVRKRIFSLFLSFNNFFKLGICFVNIIKIDKKTTDHSILCINISIGLTDCTSLKYIGTNPQKVNANIA